MSRNDYKLKGFLRIPHHEEYLIDSNGNVFHCDQSAHNIDDWIMKEIKPKINDDNINIKINDEVYDCVRLYIDTWFGINPFGYELKYDETFCIADRVKFFIPSEFVENIERDLDEFKYKGHTFKKIKGHPDYYISEYGTIYSKFYNKPVKYWNSRSLHIKVSIQGVTYDIHRLVYEHFVGEITNDHEIDHLYSTSRHHYSELEMVDGFENKRRYREKNNEFSEEEIHHLCKLMETNVSPDDIYSEMKLSDRITPLQLRNLTRNIKYGYSWSDISKDYNVSTFNPISHKPNKSKSGLTNDQVLEIYRLSHQNTAKEVAKMFDVGIDLVYTIKNRKRYKSVLTDQNLRNMCSQTIES